MRANSSTRSLRFDAARRMISFNQVTKRYPGGPRGAVRGHARDRAGRTGVPDRPLRRRQEHAAETHRRHRAPHQRHGVGQRPERRPPVTQRAVPYLRRNIGLVFQDHKLLFDRNVIENVVLPLDIAGFDRREALKRARAVIDKVGLLKREKANPDQRSPAASSSACASPARWSTAPPCCWPTSPPATSTPATPPTSWRCSATSIRSAPRW